MEETEKVGSVKSLKGEPSVTRSIGTVDPKMESSVRSLKDQQSTAQSVSKVDSKMESSARSLKAQQSTAQSVSKVGPETESSVKSLKAQQSTTQSVSKVDSKMEASVRSLRAQQSTAQSVSKVDSKMESSVRSLRAQQSTAQSVSKVDSKMESSVRSLKAQQSTAQSVSKLAPGAESSVRSFRAKSLSAVESGKISSTMSVKAEQSGTRSKIVEGPKDTISVHSVEVKPSATRPLTIDELQKPSSVQSLVPKPSAMSLAGSRAGFRLENIGSQYQLTRVWSEMDNRIKDPTLSMSTPVVTKVVPDVTASESLPRILPTSEVDIGPPRLSVRSADAILQHITEKIFPEGPVLSDKEKKKAEQEDLSGYITHPDDEEVDPNLFEPEPEPVPSDHGLFGEGLYEFPLLKNPGLDRAMFETVEPQPTFDLVGAEKYLHLCKALDVVPAAHFLKSLFTDTVSFKYYGVEPRAIRAICESLSFNHYVTNVDFEGNFFTRDAAYHLANLLADNPNLLKLNLAHCNLGHEGAQKLLEGILYTSNLQELDLSWNNLGDEGIAALALGLSENSTITHLNLSNNKLGNAAGIVLGEVLDVNDAIEHLDLSWNNLYTKDCVRALFHGLSRNTAIQSLNLAGNALSGKETAKNLKGFIARHPLCEYLDLSYNRLDDDPLTSIREGVEKNEVLLTLKLGFNPMSPEAAEGLLQIFQSESCALKVLDLEEIWVKKPFVEALEKIKEERDVEVNYRGIIANFDIKGPDVKKLLLDRAKYEAETQKKKKQRKNFGHFLLKIPDKPMRRPTFREKIDEFKIKINPDLTEALLKTFVGEKKKVDVADMRDYYMKLYPDTKLPEKKKKKGKRKGSKEPPPPPEQAPVEEAPQADMKQDMSKASVKDAGRQMSRSHHDIAERLKSTVELAERTKSIVEASSAALLAEKSLTKAVEAIDSSASKKSVTFPTATEL